MTDTVQPSFNSTYIGEVFDNIDPDQRGRLLVSVPDVMGSQPVIWAEACTPVSGGGMGFYAVPPKGTKVWIAFINGNPEMAVWLGVPHEALTDVPKDALLSPPTNPPVVLRSQLGNTIKLVDGAELDGKPGGIYLTDSTGIASVSIAETGIKITYGEVSIELTATGVAINGQALTIAPV